MEVVSWGDTIDGYIYPTGGGGWFIGINVNGTFSTGLNANSSKSYSNAVYRGAVLELATQLSTCDQLASSGYATFYNQTIYNNGRAVTPSGWDKLPLTGETPNCSYSASVTNSNRTLNLLWSP
jgi:hypothetical protein